MPVDLVQEFAALWQSTAVPPDVFGFLQSHSDAVVAEQLDLLRYDQGQRWQTSQPLKVEDYLARLPDLATDRDIKLQLAIGEFRARQSGDTWPSIDEFTARFPELAVPLQSRLSELISAQPPGKPDIVTATQTFLSSASIGARLLGRYRLLRLLGEGAFGRVWLGFDEELQRQVAIKVPTAERFQRPEDAEAYLAEARTVASLDHPHIAPVHDVGRAEDGSVYVVSKFIAGRNLAERIKQDRPTASDAASLLACVAQALHHAHQRRLIHRDIKPANILIDDDTGTPYVADFGLAIREEDYLRASQVAGTPAYMSPEQTRGEGHRLDGRSDIFSLGVVLYELLTGKRPFRGSTPNELMHQVISVDPTPPRELQPTIPAELERICLKALSKRASDRYATAAELAGDLFHWQQGPLQPTKEQTVVPKGLRSFDADDADFFLDLLPGPRNRDGLPESLSFWKSRIEQSDPEKTFSVGLIYGPSGCGKSSLVKAGLLPRLSPDVIALYVEATPDDTETRLLRGLRKQLPEKGVASRLPERPDGCFAQKTPDPFFSADLGLVQTLTALRRREGKKVVIVFDQFEQWLHAHRAEQDTELVQALRQCDGGRLQAIVMVRDDFSMAASRFLDELDIPILQGHNFATVDLFDIDHAQNVLTKFGQAFGKLPAQTNNLSEDQRAFLESVATGLAQDGKVVSVRLSLFAEMIKGKPWIPATLEEVGGTQGIGVNFLEETFSSRTANPKHRLHQQAARAVLKSLLPEVGTDIKGQMRSHSELLEAAGYANRLRDFQELLRILDGELRLITPTDPEGFQTESGSDPSSKYYQLTHDYLVPSLRDWLTRKQRETRRGRAELRLSERAALWNAKPENRHLPAWWEYLSIVGLTPRKDWTEPQRKMMRKASWVHGLRATTGIVILGLAAFLGISVRHSILEARRQAQQELVRKERTTRAEELVRSLQNADIGQVREIVTQLEPYDDWATPLLHQQIAEATDGSPRRLNLSLALVGKDDGQVEYLYEQLLRADAAQFPVIRDGLANHQARITDRLWAVLARRDKDPDQLRLRAAGALALYDAKNAHRQWNDVAPEVAAQLVAVSPVFLRDWMVALRPVRDKLLAPLSIIYRDSKRRESERSLATEILADYAADQPTVLVDLVQDADEAQFSVVFPRLAEHGEPALKLLAAELARTLQPDWQDPPLPASWPPVAAELVTQIEAADGLVAERFAFCQAMLLDQFVAVCEALKPSGYRPTRVRPWLSPAANGVGSLFRRSSPPVETALSEKGSRPLPAGQVRVAAVWTRDGRDFQIAHDATSQEIQDRDAKVRQEGFLPADVAGYLVGSADGTAAERYAALWIQRASDAEDARLFPGASDTNTPEQTQLREAGYRYLSMQQMLGSDRQLRFSFVRRRHDPQTTASFGQDEPAYVKQINLGQLQHDVSTSPAPNVASSRDHYTRMLTQAEQSLQAKADDPEALRLRAVARCGLHQDAEAVEDLTAVLAKNSKDSEAYMLRAISHARLGNKDKSAADLAEYTKLATDPSQATYLDAVVAAWQGDAAGLERLRTALAMHEQDSTWLYNAACAYATAAKAFEKDAERSVTCAADAAKLLQRAVAAGYTNFAAIRDDLDLEAIREHAEFREILVQGRLDRSYSSVWQASAAFESVELHGLPPHEHLAKCRELLSQDYRPVAMAASELAPHPNPLPGVPGRGDQSVSGKSPQTSSPRPQASSLTSSTDPPASLLAASVWHRPRVAPDAKLALAKRQAGAAIALLRQGHGEKIFSALRITDDPESLTQFVHRARARGVTVEELWDCVQLTERNRLALRGAGRRVEDRVLFGLLLTLGEFSRGEIPEALREPAVSQLAKWYREDPSSAIHGAAGWLLREWQQVDVARQVDETPVAYDPQREWFTLAISAAEQTFFQTYAVIQAGEYEIGSPFDDGARESNETRHKVRLTRPFALLNREITRGEFEPSAVAQINVEQYSPTPQHAMVAPSWYDSVRFCRWLTARVGLPEEEQCYADPQSLGRQKYFSDPDERAQGAPRNWPVNLARRGFRLPTEVEWEIAARGGMRSTYGFGADISLLDRYGWFQANSGRRAHVSRELRPNAQGLFDLHGNVYEWCHDWYGTYVLDVNGSDPVGPLTGSSRVGRGGSWTDVATSCRAANRGTSVPAARSIFDGFRLALSPSGVTPEAGLVTGAEPSSVGTEGARR